ncbi:MAG: 3-oxoacyl-[acyl-carrier-protein] reductase [Rickettsiales bacterium]|jgi:3-oxoacyl-[acyl-carrier protein] reductase|nr:3-oxoacyl-[acyl-carrier-protein] reductase [Rickettsiales bacterium]
MNNLTGKIVLITGATGGIGAAIARRFADAGAAVVLTGRDEKKLAKMCDGLGECSAMIPADLSDSAAANKLVADVLEKYGRIDILVNNAGITRDTLMMRMTDDQFDEVLRVNLRSTFLLTRAVLIPMMKNRFGRIINMASVVAFIGNAGQANYAASKGAIVAMTKSIAAEVASRDITANCIAPGFIETPMTDGLSDDVKTLYQKQIPMGRFGSPDDVAGAALFLASDDASYITGQTIHVNGGMARF